MENPGLRHTQVFPFTVLKDITDNFSEAHVIGHGASGVVYKGVLHNGQEIAVKKLNNNYDSSGNRRGNGEAQFINELMNLIGVQHQNIIRLVGYCYEKRNIVVDYEGENVLASEEERVLCLEYMQGGSLKDHISDESCGLDWQARFNIIKGVCEGLKYLHTGSEKPIYHLDLKPENIWLDGNMIPKIGDFGISRLPVGSMQTYATENAVSGTIGYMAPEYIGRNQISQKCDVYSLGFIMMRVIAGEKGPQNYDPHRPSEEFIDRVHENWTKRQKEKMPSHSLQQVKTCTEIAIRCVEYDREKRPTIMDIVGELDKIDVAQSSAISSQNTEEEQYRTLEKLPDIEECKEKGKGHVQDKMKEQVDGRTKENVLAMVTMDLRKGAKVNSVVLSPHSRWNGSKEQNNHDDMLHLRSDLQRLRETLPGMYNLIDVAEWKRHGNFLSMLFPELKDAVYDADDLLDDFRWHEMKVKLEGDASKSPFVDFIGTVIQGSFNKLNDVQRRLDHLSSQLENMGLRVVAQRFDKKARPVTGSIPNEAKIFGRDNELKQAIGYLGVPSSLKRKKAICLVNASTSKQVTNEGITSLAVLPILGIGGVGKTTLAQHICSNKDVNAHFEKVIWICVSDDFDVKRLTKEAIESCLGKEATITNFNSLQLALSNHVNNKRILIVLDDMWDDALNENGQCWKTFCAPLKTAKEGSMMLVTTRSSNVAKGVQTMEPLTLEGLDDDIFLNFFKLCVFGSESSNNDLTLEEIGRNIVPKLKGSPLAAKTLGRMLRNDLRASHWNSILESELWELKQEVTDILPALRLSYMYLPFYLKRCFSFCAVYPKDYKFKEEDLAEVWVAEGFVETEGDDSAQKTSCQYFQDLVTRSFFQKVNGGYVIHDLLHDMAQKVSEHDCFILRNKYDFDKVPLNVRHIFIHPSSDFDNSNLLSLCKHTKLRTLICKKQSGNIKSSVMDNWCTKLPRIRVMSCASTNELPDSIGSSKHLRYLKITKGRALSIPPIFCRLYNLQILDVKTCKIESLPDGFSNLRNLKRFVSQGFSYNRVSVCIIDADEQIGVRLIKNLNQSSEHLMISNVADQAEAKLKNNKYLYKLTLNWPWPSKSQIIQHNAVEVQPPKNLRSLLIQSYQGFSLPRWSHVINGSIGIFVSLTDLTIKSCENLSSLEHFLDPDYVPIIKKIQLRNCNNLVSVSSERFGDLRFLEELDVDGCPNIRSRNLVSPSLKQINLGDCGSLLDNIDCCSVTKFIISNESITSIQPQMWSLPALQQLKFSGCDSLASIGVFVVLDDSKDNIGIFPSLTDLTISSCQNLSRPEHFMHPDYVPAIKKVSLQSCKSLLSILTERTGDLSYFEELDVDGCPNIHSQSLVSPSLKQLKLGDCGSLLDNIDCCSLTKFIISNESVTSIQPEMWSLPALQQLEFSGCQSLTYIGVSTILSLGEGTDSITVFSSFPSLKHLLARGCPSISWQCGLLLPSSLQTLELNDCGDFSACVPGCLENLTSLVSLNLSQCKGLTSIPGNIWRSKLASLEELVIRDCLNLVSIGGAEAVAQIKKVQIINCPKSKEAWQIMCRG